MQDRRQRSILLAYTRMPQLVLFDVSVPLTDAVAAWRGLRGDGSSQQHPLR